MFALSLAADFPTFGRRIAGCVAALAAVAVAHADEPLSFNRDVRPILSDKCFHCHGPDEGHREADLRLDIPDAALESGVLSPGNVAESELLHRILSDDADERMPPPSSNRHLTDEQKTTLRRWIADGAEYEPHWSFVPIGDPQPPTIDDSKNWCRNPIDQFVLAGLQQAGLDPSPEASSEILVRRLYFDLIGLPPTPEELDAFLTDESPNAYELLVERLMASPHFGERLAQEWLDLARYADTHGYQGDKARTQWPWRDWVIQAFNANMPYDEFVTQQLAGDMLPNAARDQILATGFCRNHPQNAEGGVIDEEFRVEYVADRVQTFGTAFLGLTIACARCHDHKYDPITQREYYQLFSFFNNIDEAGNITWLETDTPGPTVLVPTEHEQAKLDEAAAKVTQAERALVSHRARAQSIFPAWLAEQQASGRSLPNPLPDLVAHYSLDEVTKEKIPNAVSDQLAGQMVDENFDRLSEHPVVSVPGKFGNAVELNGDDALSFPEAGRFTRSDLFSIGLWVWIPNATRSGVIFHNNVGSELYAFKGYQVSVEGDQFDVRIAHEFPHGSIHLLSDRSVPRETWVHVMLTYDGSGTAAGTRLYVNGEQMPCTVHRDNLRKDIIFPDGSAASDSRLKRQNLRIGARLRGRGLSGGRVDEITVFHRELSPLEVAHVAGRDDYEHVIATPVVKLDSDKREAIFELYIRYAQEYAALLAELRQQRAAYAALVEPVVEAMVLDEMAQPRSAHVLIRGSYDAPGEPVEPGTPAAVLAFGNELPSNRIGLARWLFRPEHPLTARVTVNRYWQMIFGSGLVVTADDFGTQGTMPSHPELLDWLARRFQTDWDVRNLLRLIVTSASYRQSSLASSQALERDPENRLLSRAPQRRLSAEQGRDNALAVSGLLVRKIGGPSVKPYQPEGLWGINAMSGEYVQDHGESLYRRSMYTFWKQTNPAPAMTLFDAPARSYCVVRREQTMTPLQSLVLWNDPQFVEAARVLAERLLREVPTDLEGRLIRGYRIVTGRHPTAEELSLLLQTFEEQRAYFSIDLSRAEQLLKVGEWQADNTLSQLDVAATAMVCSLLLNLDDCTNLR